MCDFPDALRFTQKFIHMVVCMSTDKITPKSMQWIWEMEVFGKKWRSEDRKEVGTTSDAIKMNNSKTAPVALKLPWYLVAV